MAIAAGLNWSPARTTDGAASHGPGGARTSSAGPLSKGASSIGPPSVIPPPPVAVPPPLPLPPPDPLDEVALVVVPPSEGPLTVRSSMPSTCAQLVSAIRRKGRVCPPRTLRVYFYWAVEGNPLPEGR